MQGLGLVKRRQGKLEESIDLQTQAARLDPLNQDIWVNIAWTYRGMRRFAEARTMYDRALAIAPNDRTIILRKADTDLSEGNLDAAARVIAGVAAPLGSRGYGAHINIMVLQRRYDEAIAKLTADLQQAEAQTLPPFALVNARLTLAELYTATGRSGEAQPLLTQAEAEIRRMQEHGPTTNAFEAARGNNSPEFAVTMLAVHAQLGRREEVERAAAAFIAEEAKDRWGGPRAEEDAARAFCIVGDHERALSLIERLIVQPYADCITPALLRMDPVWDPLRNDRRFQKLVTGR
jgi:serine/threonine-protein kinase